MSTTLTPTKLRCESLVAPLGIDALAPRLSWQLQSSEDSFAVDQRAYCMQVATSLASLQSGRPDVWDTGIIWTSEQVGTYAGPPLASGVRYYWHVQVWDQSEQPSLWSDHAWWEMGLLSPDAWLAQWIHLPLINHTNDPLEPCRYLRRSFHVDRQVRRARLYITAKGIYEATINGKRVGDLQLTPGWTDYDVRLQYQTYDVTAYVVAGQNAIGVLLGSGWYCGHLSNIGPRIYGSSPQLLAQLHLEYTDGTVEHIVSDEQWRAALGSLVTADLLMGETYDARREVPNWDLSACDDRGWQSVASLPLEALPVLVADCAQPIHITEVLAPRVITRIDEETQMIDFGQNLVGWMRLEIPSHAKDVIRLRHGETLDLNGHLYVANLRTAEQVDVYFPAHQKHPVIYTPRFTFHGFRYVEVRGYPDDLLPEAVSACVVGSDTPRIGDFSCGHELVNQLYQNMIWSQRGNFLSVPTDCPQRDERMGWLGDAQIFARTAAYNMDVAAFFTKWMRDIIDNQSPNGAFPDIAPRIVVLNDGAPAWGDAGIIIPWTLYRMYGDRRIIENSWEAMTRWMEYLTRANPSGLRQARNGNNYGDWLAVDEVTAEHILATRTPKDLLATAYYAYITQLMAEMAQVIGRTEAAVHYHMLRQHIIQAFNLAYVQPDGRIQGETQTAYVLALAFHLLPQELQASAARHLVADIERRDWHLATGFLGVGYLLPVLTDHGYADVAYRLLLQETYPSWGYSIRQGATTIWERWDGWTEVGGFQDPAMNSFNHYSLGSVGEWLYRYVAGIEVVPGTDGRGHFCMQPHPSRAIGWAKAEWQSVYGVVSSAWHIQDDCLHLQICLPPNTWGSVTIPTSAPREAAHMLSQEHAQRYLNKIAIQEEVIELELASGYYMFTVPYAIDAS